MVKNMSDLEFHCPTARALAGYFEVASNSTTKLFPANSLSAGNITKSKGNSALHSRMLNVFSLGKKINCLSKDQSWRIIITTLYDRVTNERQIKTAIYTEDTLKEKSQGKTVPYNEREDFLWQMSKQDKSPFCR